MKRSGWFAGRAALFTLLTLIAPFVLAAGLAVAGSAQAQASITQSRGVNWADQRDNFVNGVLYPSGHSSSDTYSSASTVADRVIGQLYSITGANTVRMLANEPTASGCGIQRRDSARRQHLVRIPGQLLRQ